MRHLVSTRIAITPRSRLTGAASNLQRIDIDEAAAIGLFVVVVFATILPLMSLGTLPLVDWPNHLARLYALGAGPGDPIRDTYAPHWALIPNLGCDLAYVVMRRFMAPEAVLRLCLCGSLVVICAATWRIQRLLFRTTTYAVSVTPLLISGLSVSMGYVNFLMSTAIAAVGLALFLSWRSSLSPTRLACLSLLATMSWLAHFAGFCVFALSLCITLLCVSNHGRHGRSFVIVLRTCCVCVAVFGPGTLLSALAERQETVSSIGYGDHLQKLRFLFAPFLASADPLNMAIIPVLGAAVLLVRKFGSVDVSPVIRPVVLVLGALIVMLPWRVGDAIDVDARLVLPFTALALAGTRVRLPSRLMPHAACTALVLLAVALHTRIIESAAQLADREVTAFRTVVARLPADSALMVARDTDVAPACFVNRPSTLPLLHLGAYAAIDRGAYVPAIFTASGMQPLRAGKAPFARSTRPIMPPTFAFLSAIADAGGIGRLSDHAGVDALSRETHQAMQSGNTAFLERWPASYDALLVLHDGCSDNLMPSRLSVLGGDDLFTLYNMRHRS